MLTYQTNSKGTACNKGNHALNGNCKGNDYKCSNYDLKKMSCEKCSFWKMKVSNSTQGDYCGSWLWWMWLLFTLSILAGILILLLFGWCMIACCCKTRKYSEFDEK